MAVDSGKGSNDTEVNQQNMDVVPTTDRRTCAQGFFVLIQSRQSLCQAVTTTRGSKAKKHRAKMISPIGMVVDVYLINPSITAKNTVERIFKPMP